MNKVNKFPIPESKGYSVDVETHMVYSPTGRVMKPHVDNRKRVCTKIMMVTGRQKTIVIKDVVRKIKEKDIKSLENVGITREHPGMDDLLLKQITTYHAVLTYIEQLQALDGNEARYNFLIELGLDIDTSTAALAVQMIQ